MKALTMMAIATAFIHKFPQGMLAGHLRLFIIRYPLSQPLANPYIAISICLFGDSIIRPIPPQAVVRTLATTSRITYSIDS